MAKRTFLFRSSTKLAPLAALVAVAACATGCSSASDTAADAGTTDAGFDPATIIDEYEAVGDIPDTEGAITKIAFLDDSTYVLKKTTGSTDGEQIVTESGTYTVDAASGTLTLTDSDTGTSRSLPFEATPVASGTSGIGEGVHALGGSLTSGGTQLTYTIACTLTLNAQTFQAMNVSCTVTSSGGSSSSTSGASSSGAGSSPTGGSGSTGNTGTSLTNSSSSGGTSLTGASDAGSTLSTSPDGGTTLTMASGQGIDVSHWDGTINWSQVHTAGKAFGYAKATEGTSFTDNTFSKNYSGMRASGIKPGAYHFFNAKQDPSAQATHFVTVLKAAGFDPTTDLAPALDLEAVPGLGTSSAAAMRTFVSTVEQKLGVTITIYTDSGDWARIGNPNQSTNPLWIAYVNKGGAMSTASKPRMPPGWSSYSIWQNSWVGKVKGINSKVDLDYAPLAAGGN